MLTYTFSSTDTAPLYQQLYRFIREDIAAGVLAAGKKYAKYFSAHFG